MTQLEYNGKIGEHLSITNIGASNQNIITEAKSSELSILWITDGLSRLNIDGIDYTFRKNDFVFLTEFHHVTAIGIDHAKMLKWNKMFYCILDHDGEVGCKGLLFYGASKLPIVKMNGQDTSKISNAWTMLEQELEDSSNLKQDMLQMLLTRFLIISLRQYKSQNNFELLHSENADIIRDYNFLVEQHFREKHTVAEYAKLLFRSPKTLSNIFKKIGTKTPLQYIHDRKTLEAKRLISYTDNSISQIGFDLGYSDIQSFSRFFKKQVGLSPLDFKKQTKREILTSP